MLSHLECGFWIDAKCAIVWFTVVGEECYGTDKVTEHLKKNKAFIPATNEEFDDLCALLSSKNNEYDDDIL